MITITEMEWRTNLLKKVQNKSKTCALIDLLRERDEVRDCLDTMDKYPEFDKESQFYKDMQMLLRVYDWAIGQLSLTN